MKLLNIFGYDSLYTAYGDDSAFFIRNKNSVIELLNVFYISSVISGLKPNKSKFEIARIGNLKGVYVGLWGLECINLMNKSVEILGCHFSYNKTLEQEKNFKKYISKIESLESRESETSNF